MAMPKFNKPEGMLDSIKSKLGFSDGGDYYDRGRRDYDDYDSGDYDDYDDDYEEDDAAPSSNYDPYDSVTTRPARGNHARPSVGSGGYRPAKLVSIDDVRAHTTVPDSLNRDPLPPRKVSSPSFGNRTMVDPGVHRSGQHAQRACCGRCQPGALGKPERLVQHHRRRGSRIQRRSGRPNGREAHRGRVHGGSQGRFRPPPRSTRTRPTRAPQRARTTPRVRSPSSSPPATASARRSQRPSKPATPWCLRSRIPPMRWQSASSISRSASRAPSTPASTASRTRCSSSRAGLLSARRSVQASVRRASCNLHISKPIPGLGARGR